MSGRRRRTAKPTPPLPAVALSVRAEELPKPILLLSAFPRWQPKWHPTRNGPATPQNVVPGSTARVWWECPVGPDHEWQVKVCDRTQDNTGCPFCAGKKVSATNSLASLCPDIATHWHPTKNGDLTPDKIVAGSEKVVWWECPNGADHEWQVKVEHRTRSGSGCPCCSGRQGSTTNSLERCAPNSPLSGIGRRMGT